MKWLILLLGLFSMLSSYSQTPKYSNEFLSIGVGARSLAMGGASLGINNSVTAGYWNPSKLAYLESDLEVGLMHAEYFAGLANYEYVGVAKRIDRKSTAGISYIRFGVDDIPNTINLVDANGNIDYDRITSFSAIDNAFLLTYATELRGLEGLSVGGNVKIVHRKVGEFAKSWGFGIDASATYEKDNLRLVAVGRDITTTFNAWSFDVGDFQETFILTGNEIPQNSLEITLPRFSLGGGYLVEIGDVIQVYPEVNADISTDGRRNTLISGGVSLDPRMGVEISYNEMVYLRSGINNFQRVPELDGGENLVFQPNLGVGLRYKTVSLDYAFSNIGSVSVAPFSHIFSLRIGIDKSRTIRRK